ESRYRVPSARRRPCARLGSGGCAWIAGLGPEAELDDAGPVSSVSTGSASVGSGAGPGGSACAGVCGTANCGDCPDEPNVLIQVAGSPTYAIDATEVTRAAYKAFLDANTNLMNQPGFCMWNTSFVPTVGNGCIAFD